MGWADFSSPSKPSPPECESTPEHSTDRPCGVLPTALLPKTPQAWAAARQWHPNPFEPHPRTPTQPLPPPPPPHSSALASPSISSSFPLASPRWVPWGTRGRYSPPGAARGACSSASCAQRPLHRHARGALGGPRPGASRWPPLPAALWLGAELAFAEGANGNCSHMEAASAARHFAYLISALTPRVMHSQAARQQGGTTGWAGRGTRAGPRGSARLQHRARALWGWLGLAAENSHRLGSAATGAPHVVALQPPDSPRFRHEARDALPRGELFPLNTLGTPVPGLSQHPGEICGCRVNSGDVPGFPQSQRPGCKPSPAQSSQAPTPMQKPT